MRKLSKADKTKLCKYILDNSDVRVEDKKRICPGWMCEIRKS